MSNSISRPGDDTSTGSTADCIASLASEINLLALDTTLATARATENGKGFAAAASEVNKLAARPSQVTASIAQEIAAIHEAAKDSLAEISSIARAIEELTAASRCADTAAEIARWTAHLAARTRDLEARVATLLGQSRAA